MLYAVALLVVCFCSQAADPDPESMLALPWKQFDQTLGSGWRVLADRREHLAAARLIEKYLDRRNDLTPAQRAVSSFHAGAELARDNLYDEALRHLDHATVPPGTRGVPEDWNELVIATRAFLRGDRESLLASKQRVEAMKSPAFPKSAAQYLEYLGQRFGAWDAEAQAKKFPHYDRAVVLDRNVATSAKASIGDVNGDGALDVVFGSDAITAADVNKDGLIDLIVPHRDGGQSYVYLQSRRVPFGPPDATIRSAEAADFDLDGLVDLVAIDDEHRTLAIYFGRKDGTFSQGMAIDNGNVVPLALAVSDLNGDGMVDIVVGNVAASSTVFFNDGPGRHYTPVRFGTAEGATFGFAIADLDGDGLMDIAAARSNATNVVYFATARPQ